MTITLNPSFFLVAKVVISTVILISGSVALAGNSWNSTNFGTQCTSSSSAAVPGSPGWTSCGAPDPTFSGWATANGGTTYSAATVYDWDANGLGVVNTRESSSAVGPHALDNFSGQDAIVFGFSNGAVTLSSVTLGWNGHDNPTTTGTGTKTKYYNDSDMSVFAWTGAQGDPTTLAGFGPASAGWTLIGNYSDVGLQDQNKQTVSTLVYSSYWLITTTGIGAKASIDEFKILALAGTGCSLTLTNNSCAATPPPGVPEPGSLALMGVAFMGLVFSRRNLSKSTC